MANVDACFRSPWPPGLLCAGLWLWILVGVGPPPVSAVVERFEELRRDTVADGKAFGATGAYQVIVGELHVRLDPADPANAAIVDLSMAPGAADGAVRFTADLFVLAPVDPSKGNGTLLLEVPNRGGKRALRLLNRGAAPSDNPSTAQHFGDGFLMERGFTVAWVGWQQDLPYDPDALGLSRVKVVSDPPVIGLARSDHVFDDPSKSLFLGDRSHFAYPVADPKDPRNVLMVRDTRDGQRRVIPRQDWRFARVDKEGAVVADPRQIYFEAGFEPGKIYEAVYAAAEPSVVGAGFAAVRDATAFLVRGEDSPVNVQRALGMGVSQSGRFLRHFVHEGFNRDATGKKVFDALWIHAAGAGRGSFNHRFAQPSRDGHAFASFDYPTDLFPFTDTVQRDLGGGAERRRDGLLRRAEADGVVPKIFFTHTGYDYWGRAASLTHTTPDGRGDVKPSPSVRLYHLASTQHFVDSFPPAGIGTRFPVNPADFRPVLRALVAALDAWATQGQAPPASRYPTVADGSLVEPGSVVFESLPGIGPPQNHHRVRQLDFGPRFHGEGVIDWQPPVAREPYGVKVPRVDADGLEVSGVRLPEIAVPVATYTPWNFRTAKIGNPGEPAAFRGAFLPLSRTQADAERYGDQRPALMERYGSREAYLERYDAAARRLVQEGFLLEGDLGSLRQRGEALWTLVADGAIRLPKQN